MPRLIEGHVAVQAFTVVTRVPASRSSSRDDTSDLVLPLVVLQRLPVATWNSSKERALYQARQFARAVSASEGKLVWIRSAADLKAYLERRRHGSEITAGGLGPEGAHALDCNLANHGTLWDAGFRMISLTHFTDNMLGGSESGVKKTGLTEAGRALVKEMEARHMIVDLAHASPTTIDRVLAMATRPVLASHKGVAGTCNSGRNLTDEQVRGVAKSGGVIGIGYFHTAICGTDWDRTSTGRCACRSIPAI